MPPDVATAVAAGCAGWLTWLALRWLGWGARAGGQPALRDIERGLPFVFDMMVLCVAGMSVQGRCNWPRAAVRRACCVTRWTARWSRCAPACRKRSRSGCPAQRQHPGGPLGRGDGAGRGPGRKSGAGAAHGRSWPRRQADPGGADGLAGAGENAVAADRLHFSLHLHRAGLSCRGAAVVEPALTRRAPPMARLRLLRVDGWWGRMRGLAWRKPRARGGHPAHAVFRGAYLRHAPSHRRGLRIALGARA